MSRVKFGGKREFLAHGLFWGGATLLLNRLPQRDLLLVLDYHRVGNPEDDRFDPDLFSVTAEQLYDQVSYLRRHASLVTLEEALAFIEGDGSEKRPRCRVLITFDDGYLDNYQIAFPILRSHGVQGVFFLTTSLVGSCQVPWWDRLAFLVRTARKRRFTLRYPVQSEVDLAEDQMIRSLRQVTDLYYRPDNTDPARFMRELAEATEAQEPPEKERRFLDWDEAQSMIGGGMAIGSHAHSHQMLSRLSPEQQRQELLSSRATLREKLGVGIDALAYPYGATFSFSECTQKLARGIGYRAAFSLEHGANLPGKTHPYSVKRICMGPESPARFRVQVAVSRLTGEYWP